jgi:hypothetical protein
LARKPVFINCPFDRDYLPLFHALVFTVARCGFTPRCALEVVDSAGALTGKAGNGRLPRTSLRTVHHSGYRDVWLARLWPLRYMLPPRTPTTALLTPVSRRWLKFH